MKWIFEARKILLQVAVAFIVCTLVFGFGLPDRDVVTGAAPEVERRIVLEHRLTALEERMTDMAWMQRAALTGLGGLILEMLFRMKRGERT